MYFANEEIDVNGSHFNLEFDRMTNKMIAKLSTKFTISDFCFFGGCFVLLVLLIVAILKICVFRKFR